VLTAHRNLRSNYKGILGQRSEKIFLKLDYIKIFRMKYNWVPMFRRCSTVNRCHRHLNTQVKIIIHVHAKPWASTYPHSFFSLWQFRTGVQLSAHQTNNIWFFTHCVHPLCRNRICRFSFFASLCHLDTGFSWFPCVYKRMLRWFPSFQVAATCLSCSPPDLNFLVTFFHICVHVK